MSEITFASKEEEYFEWYLIELQKAGFISRWKYQPKPFPLSEPAMFTYKKQLKTKIKLIEKTLLQKHQYQADFLILWTDKAINVFFHNHLDIGDPSRFPFIARYRPVGLDSWQTIVDVKGVFNQNDAWRRFSIDQKWVWQRHQIYVQKIIPVKLFKATFTPKRFFLTDKKTKQRKLKYEAKTLFEFLNSN